MTPLRPTREIYGLAALMLVQMSCSVFFLTDVLDDALAEGIAAFRDHHLAFEAVAVLTLIIAVLFEGRMLISMLRRAAHLERGLSVASGALHDLMEAYFRQWALTPAEADVAAFLIKGCTIAEIAALRGGAEATVKTHLNAIYRKSGASGRGALLAVLIDDLMTKPLVAGPVSP